MSTFTSKFATGLLLALAIIVIGPTEPSFAQDADAIRAKCIALIGNNNLTGDQDDGRGRARFEIYSSCMRQHGLKP